MFQRRGREGASSADTSVVFFIEEEAGGEAGDEGGEYEVLEEHFEEEEALVASSAREFSDESADVVVRGAGRDAGVAAVGRDGGGGEGGESREKGDRVGHFHAQVRHEHDVVEDVERRGGVVDGVVALRDAHGRHEHREDARRDHLHYERQRASAIGAASEGDAEETGPAVEPRHREAVEGQLVARGPRNRRGEARPRFEEPRPALREEPAAEMIRHKRQD
mmetsp:Transcript_15813/g.47817  ORF Transcript_15813/g.47817 Transcript_15813/m.47817 type:complete len:221 (-) Transcript_15813:127-789(-)